MLVLFSNALLCIPIILEITYPTKSFDSSTFKLLILGPETQLLVIDKDRAYISEYIYLHVWAAITCSENILLKLYAV